MDRVSYGGKVRSEKDNHPVGCKCRLSAQIRIGIVYISVKKECKNNLLLLHGLSAASFFSTQHKRKTALRGGLSFFIQVKRN